MPDNSMSAATQRSGAIAANLNYTPSLQLHSPTRWLYASLAEQHELHTVKDLLAQAKSDQDAGVFAVCVIENISPSLADILQRQWGIEADFFNMHATNPDIEALRKKGWRHGEWDQAMSSSGSSRRYDQLIGKYELSDTDVDIEKLRRLSVNYYDRQIYQEPSRPVNCTMNISYIRASPTLYLFLVDPPLQYQGAVRQYASPNALPVARFPYFVRQGGIALPPQQRDKVFTPFEALKNLFVHRWHMRFLAHQATVLPSVPLLYLISHSLWYGTIEVLEREIRHVSFHDIRSPTLAITNKLHDFRERLFELQTIVTYTFRYIPPEVRSLYNDLWKDFNHADALMPLNGYQMLVDRAENLHNFLLETFQLLMTTLSVQDSQQTLKQTQQSVFLATLATFYLPLSLTVGVFGMNLSQMNDSGPSIWVFVVTGILVVLATLLLLQLSLAKWRIGQLLELNIWKFRNIFSLSR